MLSIFRSKPLDQAFNISKYKELLTKTYNEILLYEIDANLHSYAINKLITSNGSKRYTRRVSLTIIALLFSIVLIMANKFIKIKEGPAKIQVVNIEKLTGAKSTSDSINDKSLVSPTAAKQDE